MQGFLFTSWNLCLHVRPVKTQPQANGVTALRPQKNEVESYVVLRALLLNEVYR
jgi:hypothetical protein